MQRKERDRGKQKGGNPARSPGTKPRMTKTEASGDAEKELVVIEAPPKTGFSLIKQRWMAGVTREDVYPEDSIWVA